MLGVAVVGQMTPVSRGYTPAIRRIATLADARRVFVKAASNDYTAVALRAEQRIYDQLDTPFLAKRLAFAEGEHPVMILEDLSGAYWPPAWRPGDIAAVRATMTVIAATEVSGIPNLDQGEFTGWKAVALDPEPFLGLNLVSAGWLASALPTLIAAEAAADLSGTDLLHCDLRSDNLCILDGRVIVIDWNFASVGNAEFDLAFWAPSLAAEGGGVPEDLLPHAPGLAALASGFFAARAGLPLIPHAPRVRHIQQVQLREALPWAIRALKLPTP